MKKILGLVVLSLLSISASAADLMALSADPGVQPSMGANIVVEGSACPGIGATGFSSTGLLLSCQSGVWREPESVQIQSGEAYTSNCSSYWVYAAQSICYGYPHVDIVFEEPMADIPRIIVSDKSLFPFTPCAAGAADAIDHIVTNVTRFGFRLLGGASPASSSGCGAAASNSRAVSLFSWFAITKK